VQILRWLAAGLVVTLGAWVAQHGFAPGETSRSTAARAPTSPPVPLLERGESTRTAVPAASAQPSPAAADLAAELGVRLVGIVFASTPHGSSAVIEEADGSRHGRALGDAIAGGRARVAGIAADAVEIEDGSGRRARLPLESAARSSTPPELPRTAKELFELPSEQLARLRGPDRKELAVDLETALRDLESGLLLTANPARRGVRIEHTAPQSALTQLGLVPGDVILSVDGAPVDSARAGMEGLARSLYSVGGSTLLTVERADGTRVQIATGSGMALPREPSSEIRRR
jgi:type II secretory pathway component PulC